MINPKITSFADAPFSRLLARYHGPQVKLHMMPADKEYIIARGVLCAESPYFRAMFEGSFAESKSQIMNLEEMDGVITARSLEALIQWLYTREVKFDEASIADAADRISAAMELVHLAEYYMIKALEYPAFQYFTHIIESRQSCWTRVPPQFNARDVQISHIVSGLSLRQDHPVRRKLASASVQSTFFADDKRFAQICEDYPEFATDFRREARDTMEGILMHQTHHGILPDEDDDDQ